MNNNEAKIFAAQLGADIPTLDLHGYYPVEALEKLELFLFDNVDSDVVKVIYGGGTGKLRQEVLSSLKDHPLPKKVVEDNGLCFVLL